MDHEKGHIKHYLELHFIVFVWGFTAVLGKLIDMNALMLVWYRVGISLPVLALWMWWKKIPFGITGRQFLRYLAGGWIITLHWIAFFMAIKVSNVSLTLLVLSSGAFFASLLEPLFYRRKIRLSELIMGWIVVSGIYLIFRVSDFHLTGFLWALLASFTSALFSVGNGLMAYENTGTKLSFYQLSLGFLSLTVYLLWSGGLDYGVWGEILPKDRYYMLILAVVCTAYPFARSISLMRYISPYTVMLTVNMEPVYGIILALLVFGEDERMQPMFYAGTLVVLAVVLWNARIKLKEGENRG